MEAPEIGPFDGFVYNRSKTKGKLKWSPGGMSRVEPRQPSVDDYEKIHSFNQSWNDSNCGSRRFKGRKTAVNFVTEIACRT